MKENTTITEMVKKYLEENGYCGLHNELEQCGCMLPNIMSCECMMNDCFAWPKQDSDGNPTLDGVEEREFPTR